MNEEENGGMALYMIGDVQGCDQALGNLLERIDFSPSRDSLVLLGDLAQTVYQHGGRELLQTALAAQGVVLKLPELKA